MAARIALLNGLVPMIAAVGAYLIALLQGYPAACMPLWEGCTSISRAARFGDAIFWFRGLMMPLSMLLVVFWIYQVRWLAGYAGRSRQLTLIFSLAMVSAVALVLYVNFLGSAGGFYNFMRRFGVTVYFGLGMLTQLLSVHLLYQYRHRLPTSTQQLFPWLLTFVGIQWVIGLVSLGITITQPAFKSAADNIVEWNFALAMMAFYWVTALIWRREGYHGHLL